MTNHVQSFRVAPPDKGRLISFEAVDGAGKDTVADRVIAWLERSGHPVFDFDQAGYAVPIPPEADVLKISEPSYWGVGKAIRNELRKDAGYDAWYLAQAFALDRQALYARVVIPFLRARPNRYVIQIRGLMSSLVYQTLQAEAEGLALSVQDLLNLPGNRLELSRRPDLIFLLMASEETIRERQAGRAEHERKDVFSDPAFQTRVAARYLSEEVQAPFKRLDTKIIPVNAEAAREQVAARCIAQIVAHMPQAAR